MSKLKLYKIKQLYKNGDLRLLGSKNIYGMWNGLVFRIYKWLENLIYPTKKEYILCAANFYDDKKNHVHAPKNIKIGFVVCGMRHHNCIETFAMIVGFPYDENGLKLMQTEIEGFLTSKNRFVGREEAGRIAFASKQTKKLINKLHSEDLW
jgi:hypothetical protein